MIQHDAIVVGVHVDEAGGEHLTAHIQHRVAVAGERLSDLDDALTAQPQVGGEGGGAGAVEEQAVAQQIPGIRSG